VAQDNVVIVTDPSLISDDLMFVAGKFFLRFDPETCTFVSNLKEYYPDD
jgi:F-box protein 21